MRVGSGAYLATSSPDAQLITGESALPRPSRQARRNLSSSSAMDHESALEAANQALSGGAFRGASRLASVELRGVNEIRGPARGAAQLGEASSLPNGAWELAAMISVALATLLFVLGMWFL